jgi:hypothetical protein
MVNLSAQFMHSETRNIELEGRVKQLNYERKVMEDRLDSKIKELERQEEDGNIMCAASIIQELKLTLSQWMVSQNIPCMEQILPTNETCITAASNEASYAALNRNNTGFRMKLKFWKKSSNNRMEAAYRKCFKKQHEEQVQINSRIIESEEICKELNYENKLSKAILNYQIQNMQRQQEAGILNCALLKN